MVTVTFILNAGADTLASWLKATWRPAPSFKVQLQILRDNYSRQGAPRQLTADGVIVFEKEGQDSAIAYPIENMVLFELLPLSEERVEVRSECRYHATLLPWFADLLAEMVKRWPEMRDTLDVTSNTFPDTETLQQALDAFTQRIRRLKVKPGQRAAMYGSIKTTPNAEMARGDSSFGDTHQIQLEGKHPCKATFYLDNTTARDAATWLSTNWSVSHKKEPDIWTFPGHFGMTRAFQAMPVIETMDDRGRHLLTIGIDERTAGGPRNPFAVSDAGAINARGIEILVIPIGTNKAQVIAACNALLLLDNFTTLLWHAKTAYGDNLRQVHPSFGIMDTPLFEDDPIAAEYFKKMNARFDAMLEAIEPTLAYLQPQNDDAHTADSETPRDDEPASAVNEPARDDPPAVTASSIPETKSRGRAKAVRQAKLRKLFDEDNTQDLQVSQLAKLYGVNRKTIDRDLKELGLQKPQPG